tara:strand:- start:60613 stop:61095 length:483 start_codon:yes stop_codon:yes gene_type:complete
MISKLQNNTMSFQFLPNYFKKVGLFIFIVSGIPSFSKGLVDGRNAADGIPTPEAFEAFTFLGIHFTESLYDTLVFVGIIGLFLYLFSKDKIMDEFLLRIRHEAIQLTFLATVVFVFLMLIINPNWRIGGMALIEYQVVLFLIINKAKKFWSSPGKGAENE